MGWDGFVLAKDLHSRHRIEHENLSVNRSIFVFEFSCLSNLLLCLPGKHLLLVMRCDFTPGQYRRNVIDQVVSTALPESTNADEAMDGLWMGHTCCFGRGRVD